MKRAIISDVHGNLEALRAVLEDIDRERVDEILAACAEAGETAWPVGTVVSAAGIPHVEFV